MSKITDKEEKDDFIVNHLKNIKIIKAIYEGKRFFVECSLDDKDGAEIPNSNFAIKEIELPNFKAALQNKVNDEEPNKDEVIKEAKRLWGIPNKLEAVKLIMKLGYSLKDAKA